MRREHGMPPRKTTDFGALFESLIEDLRIQITASVERSLSDFNKRLARMERRIDQLDPHNAVSPDPKVRRVCSLCDKRAVARGLCSAHYQQLRYRERKSRLNRHTPAIELPSAVVMHNKAADISSNN